MVNVSLEEDVIKQGIASDAAYVGCLVSDLADAEYASFVSVVSLCMVPYLSLFVHESYRKLGTVDPSLASQLSSDVESIVARSRHSLKLFEDTRRGVDGQVAYFRDKLLPAHSVRFLGNTWLSLARFLEKDLGLFSYDGRLIGTTHGANFHLGIEPGELFEKAGPEIRAIYEEYGRYFGHLGARLDTNEPTFVSRLDAKCFNQRPKDVRADKYYRSVFEGHSNPDLNAVLTVFRGMMNFAGSVITAGTNPNDIEYTVFKIRYLTLYEILASLQVLRDELPSLTRRSARFIGMITGTAEARLVLDPDVKPFRNTLMHYNLDSRIDTAAVNISQPLFGLVSIYFPAFDAATFAARVDCCIAETATAIDEWAGV